MKLSLCEGSLAPHSVAYSGTEGTCSTERNISTSVHYRGKTVKTKKQPWPKFKNTRKWTVLELNRKQFRLEKNCRAQWCLHENWSPSVLLLAPFGPQVWQAGLTFLQLALFTLKTIILDTEKKLEHELIVNILKYRIKRQWKTTIVFNFHVWNEQIILLWRVTCQK